MDRYSHAFAATTPDATARKILVILTSDFRARAGETLPIHSLSAGWHQRNPRRDDFEAGLQYAIGHGWIRVSSNGAYHLTDRGYAAA